jgi:hypothetical protein
MLERHRAASDLLVLQGLLFAAASPAPAGRKATPQVRNLRQAVYTAPEMGCADM